MWEEWTDSGELPDWMLNGLHNAGHAVQFIYVRVDAVAMENGLTLVLALQQGRA